jgi:hypothetical protein
MCCVRIGRIVTFINSVATHGHLASAIEKVTPTPSIPDKKAYKFFSKSNNVKLTKFIENYQHLQYRHVSVDGFFYEFVQTLHCLTLEKNYTPSIQEKRE